MLVGYNYPWPANRYITIGPPSSSGRPQPWAQDTRMVTNFKTLKDVGITVIRVWLMGDGANYNGLAEFGFDNSRGLFWEFQPPDQVDKAFVDSFNTLLSICEDANIQIIPSLIDFPFFDEPRKDSLYGGTSVNYPAPRGPIPTNFDFIRGRRSIASNDVFRRKFIEGTLEPLLKVAAEKKKVIYAFEVINEPWWCISPITGSLFGRKMDKDDLIAFLSDCIASIKKFGLRSTIGHRYLSDIYGAFSQIKVDLPQHHYYAHPFYLDSLMSAKTMPNPAKILGEFASFTPKEMKALQSSAENERDDKRKQRLEAQVKEMEIQINLWPDLYGLDDDPTNVLEHRLSYAKKAGYELAMIWPGVVDPSVETTDVLKLSSNKFESVRRFISRR